jgi:hypothetical protein
LRSCGCEAPNTIAFAGIFPFIWLPNAGNFAFIERMRFRVKESPLKTALGSVATVATTQQKLASLGIAGPHAQGCRSQGAGECSIRFLLIALE